MRLSLRDVDLRATPCLCGLYSLNISLKTQKNTEFAQRNLTSGLHDLVVERADLLHAGSRTVGLLDSSS